MRDDHHAASGIVQRDRVHQRTETEDHVAPALPTRRSMIEFAENAPELSLVRVYRGDTAGRQSVENAELLFAEAFVNPDRLIAGRAALFAKKAEGLARADIGRDQQNVGPVVRNRAGEPSAERAGLILSERGKRNIDVAMRQFDPFSSSRMGSVARHISRTFTVADNPETRRPAYRSHSFIRSIALPGSTPIDRRWLHDLPIPDCGRCYRRTLR